MSSSNPTETPKKETGEPHETLKQMKARKKKELRNDPGASTSQAFADPYPNATNSIYVKKGKTGIIVDVDTLYHDCKWDRNHPENPQRITAIRTKIRDRGLLSQCLTLQNPMRMDLHEKILYKHTQKHYDKLKELRDRQSVYELEEESAKYDSIYFTNHTFDAANRSLSAVLNVVEEVARGKVQNGMAVVRPPGHHAMKEEYNGYCFYNNVAIAAEMCIRYKFARRILIVDIDVHHGQGIQRMFYNRKDVLYFSIHRYEHGTFWPNLLESNFNYIGKGDGLGYNINVPLNATGLTDDDYLAIVFSILLPIGYEFNPDLVIVAAGYDAAVGCPEGKMNVTPAFYSHLITHLSGLATGSLAVILEGGYFIPSLSESATMTLKALLGGPCPILEPIRSVHPTVTETICNVRRMLLNIWNCFKICETVGGTELAGPPTDVHEFSILYAGQPEGPPHRTRNAYPTNTSQEIGYYRELIHAMAEKHKASMKLPVCYVYDDQMLLHVPPPGEVERPERPERLVAIMRTLHDFGVADRMVRIPAVRRDFSFYNVHSPAYMANIAADMRQSRDMYANEYTADVISLAVSGLLNVVDTIFTGEARAGVAIIRPPGHHAEYDRPMGYCFVNNVAIAANYIYMKYRVERILIIDFDIHHGNSTQNMYYHSKKVMYISIHRDDDGKFFPAGSPKNYTYDGHGNGRGYNVNIPFSGDKMGDTEYIAVFHNIILPIAYSFAPQVILVSAGFDAAIHDPLGGYTVYPETFGHFIHMLKPLAEGRIILALEGGYNITTTAYSMALCAKALLGDPLLMPKNLYKQFSPSAIQTIRNVTDHFKKYYNVLMINKKLGLNLRLYKSIGCFIEHTYTTEMSKLLDLDRFQDSEYVEEEIVNFNASL